MLKTVSAVITKTISPLYLSLSLSIYIYIVFIRNFPNPFLNSYSQNAVLASEDYIYTHTYTHI